MKTAAKIVGGIFALICVVAGALALYWGAYLPRVAAPRNTSVPSTPNRIARGKYLFNVVMECNGCHTTHDYSRFGGPIVPGTIGKGVMMAEEGMPGLTIVASNITSDKETGIGGWSDGEKIRAIREGIDRNGHVLFPMMPYTNFRHLSDYDVESLVAYLNTLEPIKNKLPRTSMPLLLSVLVRGVPRPTGSVEAPLRGPTKEYGEYLSQIGNCITCHTQSDQGKLKKDLLFAGGAQFKTPAGTVVSANITPDPETGIGSWTEDYFIQRFRAQLAYDHSAPPKVGPDQFTVMPWLSFSHLDQDDLLALYCYLQSLPSIKNKVEKHPGAAQTAKR